MKFPTRCVGHRLSRCCLCCCCCCCLCCCCCCCWISRCRGLRRQRGTRRVRRLGPCRGIDGTPPPTCERSRKRCILYARVLHTHDMSSSGEAVGCRDADKARGSLSSECNSGSGSGNESGSSPCTPSENSHAKPASAASRMPGFSMSTARSRPAGTRDAALAWLV